MRKIVLNKYGESVVPQENTDDQLSFGLKLHGICGGFVDLTPVSKTHQVLYCRRCNFRFVFPKEIDTWSKLKQFVKNKKRGKK